MNIRYQIVTVTFIIFLLTLLAANNAICQDNAERTQTFNKIDELLNQGDNQQAWQILQELPDDGSDPADRLWRMARAQYEMGRVAVQKIPDFFKKAEEYARTAIAKDANNSKSYKWLAISLGAQTKYSDTKTQVRQSSEVKKNIEKAIALNPEDDIAYLVLSRWHYKVSALGWIARTFAKVVYGGLPQASLDKAEELLWRAIRLHDRISHRYNLAKVYKRMNRQEAAEAQLRLALLLPVTFPEEAEELEKSRKKLEEWQ